MLRGEGGGEKGRKGKEVGRGDDRTYITCNISQRIQNHSSSYYEAKPGAKKTLHFTKEQM
jgi:hypothetical protein